MLTKAMRYFNIEIYNYIMNIETMKLESWMVSKNSCSTEFSMSTRLE